MDKNAIKKFAVWARRELIARVSQKAEQYGITEEHHGDAYAERIGEQLLTRTEQNQRKNLIICIEQEGYKQVMEEVAYTWFNRFIALRFMEVNGYLPTRIRVFTDEENAFKPQILAEAIHMEMDGLDMEKVYAFKEKNQTEELFKYLIITQCNALSSILPGMFQTISDYTELLFPDNLLREGSVIQQMIELIPEEDWQDQVQIIGWLYQYYNTEPKDQVFANLKKNIKISKHDIPAATQLFTPDWIVRYMVENSLGRLWVEGHPDEALQSTWKYYLPEAEQEPQVQAQLAEIRKEYANIKPEDIRCIDPCMGSGHILCYLFDVLVQIYEAYGYSTREAVQSIVENNLYGLDIDDRAAQLAYFAVMMKARQYDRRFFTRGIQPHVMAIQESTRMPEELWGVFGAEEEIARRIHAAFIDAKEYGSLICPDVTPAELHALRHRMMQMHGFDLRNMSLDQLSDAMAAVDVIAPLADLAEMLSQKYDVVVTNPPYMGITNATSKLVSYVKSRYLDNKIDLFSVFMEKAIDFLNDKGMCGLITQQTWMFISSFKQTRSMLYEHSIINLCHLGTRAFEEISGEVVQSVAYCLCKCKISGHIATYVKLDNCDDKCGEFSKTDRHFQMATSAFSQLPDQIMAYWLSPIITNSFGIYKPISCYASGKIGLQTGDNNRFLRLWHEIDRKRISFSGADPNQYWIPYNKAGGFRRWYGNNEYVLNWQNNGEAVTNCRDEKGNLKSRPQNREYYFMSGLTWSDVCTGLFSMRLMPQGFIFDSCAPTLFSDTEDEKYILALYNTKVAQLYLDFLAPTIHYTCGSVVKLPFARAQNFDDRLVDESIALANQDWDSFETSWDFECHPLVANQQYAAQFHPGESDSPETSIRSAYTMWQATTERRFNQLKANEEELNRIFIDIYGLQDELTPEVEDKDVTVRRADLGRDIRSFISYAVGCMFGRYSLDHPGLAYAGGDFIDDYYPTYQPDWDGILPITDDEYFDDDIVGRFVQFVETVYGRGTLEENLRFIADALGGTGTPRQVIRSYFLNDFYADHLKIYQKRPIYWLFDSGKKNGFKCLIYMHRYEPDTIARIRTDYVHEQQSRYRTAIEDLEKRVASAATAERVKLTKQLTKIKAQTEELRLYEEKIHHLADQMISIDLDDGVKVNYAKFADVLAKIK